MLHAIPIIMKATETAQYKIYKDGIYIVTITGLEAAKLVYAEIGATKIERIS
jgi:uncharacterized protein with FMN-binding domain